MELAAAASNLHFAPNVVPPLRVNAIAKFRPYFTAFLWAAVTTLVVAPTKR